MEAKEKLIRHYEECFEKHGDTSKGVDWPNEEDARKRYQVMCEVTCFGHGAVHHNGWQGTSVLDYGCGLGHLLEYMKKEYKPIDRGSGFKYFGYDPSAKMVNHCMKKHGGLFSTDLEIFQQVDYTIMCGVFTERKGTYIEAEYMFVEEIKKAWAKSRIGIAFNVMSSNVEWKRDDLFHLDTSRLVGFVITHLSRNFIIRNDYGLYEYTVYVYKQPTT